MLFLQQTIDEQMTKIKNDAAELCNPSYLPSKTEADMHTAMQKAVDAVRTQLLELTKTYELLMKSFQEKRELYIVCVKFHMNLRQVCYNIPFSPSQSLSLFHFHSLSQSLFHSLAHFLSFTLLLTFSISLCFTLAFYSSPSFFPSSFDFFLYHVNIHCVYIQIYACIL